MRTILAATLCAVVASAGGVGPASAELSAPGTLPSAAGTRTGIDLFDKEMTVQNWILCINEASAESIAVARAEGIEPARKVYGALQTSKTCGQFSALKVILRESLFESAAGAVPATHVYRASVNLGADWPTGFVVSGGLSE